MPVQVLNIHSYIATLYAVPTFVASVALLLLGIFTVYRERGSRVGLAFLGLILTAAWWLFSFSMMYSAATEPVARWWTKAAYLGVPLIAPSAYLFTVTVLRIREQRKTFVRLAWLLGFASTALTLTTDELVSGVYHFWWGYYTRFDWLSIPFLAYFFTILVASLVEYWLEYRKSRPGTHRLRIRSLMLGSAIGYLGAYDFIAAYGIPLYPIGYLAVIVFLLLLAHTIKRYRLVDLTPSFAADQIVAIMADPLIVCDEEGIVRVVNKATCTTFGYTEQELIGQPISLLCPPSHGQHLRDLMTLPTVCDRETEFCCKDGEVIPVSISLSHLEEHGDTSVGVVLIARDIRARQTADAALRASQTKLHTIISKAPVTLFVLDKAGLFTLAEGQFLDSLAIEPEQLVGRSIFDLLPDNPEQRDRFQRALQGIRTGTTIRLSGYTYDTQYSPLHDESGQVIGLIGVATDVTERVQAEEALRQSEERYALAARGANDGLWDWNLAEQNAYFSPRWKTMLGFGEDEVSADPDEWLSRVHPDDLERVRQELAAHLGGVTAHFESEFRIRHADESYRWMLCRGLAVRDADGVAYRMVGSLSDVTGRKETEAQLMHGAFHDALTGLPNRALLMNRIRQAIHSHQSQLGLTFALLYLDFDHFKVVNDSMGHSVGDQLLIGIANRLKANLHHDDTVARLGGDEFVVLLTRLPDHTDAIQIAQRLQHAMLTPFKVGTHEVFTTVSIGIVTDVAHYEQPEDILRDADTALYQAKRLGGGRYLLFGKEMHEQAVLRMQTETDLRRALERNEFVLHYQPIIALEDSRITGFEALLRWHHPERGLVPPNAFIPIAEETGLILPIGDWVLREACRQLCVWQDHFRAPHLTVSVNLSAKQLVQGDLVQQIQATLAETGLPPQSLKLEVTESVLIENAESASHALHQLQALGVEIHLDDFGTGYSSLHYLHRFPVNVLKIDRSFVRPLGQDGNQANLIETIIALADKLHLQVVAEGVEYGNQLNQLRALSCGYAQGYYFSPPVIPEKAAAMLTPDGDPNGSGARLTPLAA